VCLRHTTDRVACAPYSSPRVRHSLVASEAHGRPAITNNSLPQHLTIESSIPDLTTSSTATHLYTHEPTPTPSPPRPRWPLSCALACPPQSPATLSLKHRTPQQAVLDNMVSTRKCTIPTVTFSKDPADLPQQLHRQWRHHARHHRRRLRYPSRRHSQHQRLQHQLALHPQTLPYRWHRL
jgi:hypothetical protein